MSLERDLKNAVCILPNRLFYVSLSAHPREMVANKHFFCIDQELVYWNFYLDFGPLNLGLLYRFCMMLNNKLNDPALKDKMIYFYSGTHPHRRANAMYLMSSWCVLFIKKTPEEAFKPFRSCPAVPPWHDATQGACNFNLTILDTLRGLLKAAQYRFFDFNNFNLAEYEHFEQVENGDLNWCVDGKFIMFAGPHNKRDSTPDGYHSLCPDDYIPYFKRKNVELVVRLNKKYYDARKFTSNGIRHEEMYFTDGSNPPEDILQRFLAVAEATNGAIAVHCKAGLGRTGCVIGAYIMKHYQFTAEELIGWLRIVRPGSIIGPQQQYMQSIQHRMWQDGEVMRSNLAKEAALAKSATAAKASNNINGQSNKVSSNASSSKSIASSSKQQLPAIANSPNTSSKEGASGSSNSNSVNGITEKFRTASIDSNGGNSGSFLPQTVRPNSRSGSCSDVSGSSTPVPVSTNSAQTTGLNERTQGDDLINRRYHMKAEHSVHSPDQSANSFSSIHAMDATANTSGNVSINSKPPSSQSQSSSFSNASPVSRMGKMLDINKKN